MIRNIFLFAFLLMFMPSSVMARCCYRSGIDYNYPQSSMNYKKHIQSMQENRAVIYNALNLTDKQIQKYEDLLKENYEFYERKFDELMNASYKVKALTLAGACDLDINKQKRIVKNIKKDIEHQVDLENKSFVKGLTREQRAKYSMIKKLEQKDYKASTVKKDYYKSNPQMRPFGNPKPCAVSDDKNEDK